MNAPPDPRQVLDTLLGQPHLTICAQVEALPEPHAQAVLEEAVRARALPVCEALAGSSRKPLAKAAKKALYQLRSLGVASPGPDAAAPSSPAGPAAPAAEEPLPSLASAITGNGERALIIGRPLRGRVETLQLVVADEHGVVHLGINAISRGQYRRLLRDAGQKGPASAVELPLDEARALLAEAVGQNLRSRTPFPAGLDAALRHLEVSPAADPPTLPLPEESDLALAARGASLHAEPELAQWLPPVDALRRFAQKAQEVAASPLYLDEAQRAEQLRHTVVAEAEACFTEPVRRVYALRLWRMARMFERTSREDAAQVARAEARRLFHGAPGPLSPFAVALFEKVLALSQPAPDPEKRTAGGLILP